MTDNHISWWVIIAVWIPGFAMLIWVILQARRSSPKAMIKRRLLVNEDGQTVWRVVRGRCLVGGSNRKQVVEWGQWADDTDWAIIQAAKGKLVVYRFDARSGNEPRTGVIQVCDSWRALEAAVPARIFEAALLEAGVKKPSEYREVPLKL
jgi:hypothetical protein